MCIYQSKHVELQLSCVLPIAKMYFQPKAVNRRPLCLTAPTVLGRGRTSNPSQTYRENRCQWAS